MMKAPNQPLPQKILSFKIIPLTILIIYAKILIDSFRKVNFHPPLQYFPFPSLFLYTSNLHTSIIPLLYEFKYY